MDSTARLQGERTMNSQIRLKARVLEVEGYDEVRIISSNFHLATAVIVRLLPSRVSSTSKQTTQNLCRF
jgi:hypothetical protein